MKMTQNADKNSQADMEKDMSKDGIMEELQHVTAVKNPVCGKAATGRKMIKLSIGDTVIVTDQQRLIQACPYFDSLLRFHADDNMDGVSLVPPENVDLHVFLVVLYSLSNGNMNLDITKANLWDFIVLSKYFQLDQLEKQCMLTFRKLIPTWDIDEVCRFWRKGHSTAFGEITALTVAAISLKLQNASHSQEFLDLAGEELVALLSSEGFLPLREKDVCKAVVAWSEHDPANRKTAEVLKPILEEIIQDPSTKHLFASFGGTCQKPREEPRVTNNENHWMPSDELLKEFGCKNGVVVGNYLYSMDTKERWDRHFFRIDLKTSKPVRTRIDSFDEVEAQYEGEANHQPAEYRLCFAKLPGGHRIGCFIPYWMDMACMPDRDGYYMLANLILLYNPVTDKWTYLPSLPLPRIHTAMIQLGPFLYVIGGLEHNAKYGCARAAEEGNAHHCYRLDLSSPLSGRKKSHWERIADLKAPRTKHRVQVQCGRIIVYGGRTETKAGKKGKKTFQVARWCEAYDPTLNIWTIFHSETLMTWKDE